MQNYNKLVIQLFKYKKALKAYGELFNKSKLKSKHAFLFPIRQSGISYRHACLELSFNATSYMWKNCLNRSERNKG